MAYDLQAAQIYLPKNKVIWDNTYKNVIRFTTDEKISQLLDLRLFYENYNFVFNNFLKPNSIVLSINDNSDFNAIEMANLKMIVVKAFFATETRFFYYFVDSVIQINGTTWRYNLSLDVLTTLKINKDFRINGIFTERLHFDRYQKNASGNIILSTNIYDLQTANDIDSGVDSADYIYTFKTSELFSKTFTYNLVGVADENDVKKAKPKGFILIYVQDKESKFKCRIHNNTRTQDELLFVNNPLFDGTTLVDNWEYHGSYLLAPYTIYVVPIAEVAYNINLPDGGILENYYSMQSLLKILENRTDKILDIKFTSYLPADLNFDIYRNEARINPEYRIGLENENSIIPTTRTSPIVMSSNQEEAVSTALILWNIYKDYSFVEEPVSILDMLEDADLFRIPTAANKRTFRRATYEPQMLKKPYYSITIKSPYSEGYDFSFFDVINSNIDITATFRRECSVVLETSKEINYFVNSRVGTGLFGNVENKVGDISNPIYNLTWEYDSLAEYLQSNKNAVMTSALTPFAGAAAGAVTGFATTKNPKLTAFTTGFGLIGGIVNAAIQFDNIKNKPNSIKVGTNALLADYISYDSLLPKIYFKGLRKDKREIVFDWIYRYGYSWNRASNSIDWFNRYIFNYVKTIDSVHAHIEGLAAAPFINEAIENELSRILNDGVTFWEEDSGHIYNWEYENFEKAILEN